MGKHTVTRLTQKQVEAGLSVKPDSEISLSRLRSKLSDTLNRVQYGRESVLVTNYGKKVALLMPVPEE